VQIKIAASDRVGLMQEVSSIISNMGINMLSLSAEQASEDDARLSLTIEIFDIDQLHLVMKQLDKIESVKEVKRV